MNGARNLLAMWRGSEMKRELAIPATIILLSFFVAFFYGHDANWDLRNYHIYAAFAFLEGRYDTDIAPAGIQSFFNPLLDLPYYLVLRNFGLQPASLFQSLYFSAYAYVLFLLNRSIFTSSYFAELYSAFTQRVALPVIATLFGVTAMGTFSQFGTTFNEIQLGFLVISGVAVALKGLEQTSNRDYYMVASGLLLGAAAGLKLTAFIYAPGLAIGIFLSLRFRDGVRGALAFSIGWSVGLLLLYGFWGLFLHERFENPLYPFYNSIFNSDWYPDHNFRDVRFLPKSPAEIIAYPANWAFGLSGRVTEPLGQDPRLFLFLVALIVSAAARNMLTQSRHARFIIVVSLVSYAVWLIQFSILRYAVAIEGLAASVIVISLVAVFTSAKAARDESLIVFSLLAFIGIQSLTKYPEWSRIPFARSNVEVSAPPIEPGTLIIVAGPPSSYVLPFLDAPDATFVGISDMTLTARGTKFYEATVSKIQEHNGPLKALIRGDPLGPELQGEFGISLLKETCEVVTTSFEPNATDIAMCSVEK